MSPTLLTGREAAPQSGQVRHLVIFLHGVGSNGDDLIGLGNMMDLPDTQFLSPNAPFAYDMAPFGYQWFSLMDRSYTQMLAGIKTAAPILHYYIEYQLERFKLTPADLALVGFSQGSMMSLYAAPRCAQQIAGVVAISGAMLAGDVLKSEIQSRPPVCLIHGEQDEVVPFGAMELARSTLAANDVAVEAHARPALGHGIDERGLELTEAFLKKIFKL